MHAGGVRGGAGAVGPLPDGAVFTATAVDRSSLVFSCTISGGTCSITGLPAGHQWDVTETAAPGGYYLDPLLASGFTGFVAPFPYTFRTTPLLFGSTTVDVPGGSPNGLYTDDHLLNQTFSGLLATSLDDPPALARCGLNIALVLDQSNSMADNGKQTRLKAAASDAVTALTGTPSTVAIYTFGSDPGPGVPKTSTINASTAQPLQSFIRNLPDGPTLQGATNWDQGLSQVAAGFDLVIFLTDGQPTASRIRPIPPNPGNVTQFTDVEQGVFSANAIKAGGTRIVGVGIGLLGGAQNLRAVSGPTLGQDYFPSSDTAFGDVLQTLTAGECGDQLTITKQVEDPTGALVSPAPADANGWTFSNTISRGTIASPVTSGVVNGVNGVAGAAVSIPAASTPTVAVTESVNAGYTLVAARCSVAGVAVPTIVIGATARFNAAAAQPLACTFVNRRPLATPTIATTPSAGGPAGASLSDTATVSGGFAPGGAVTFRLFAPADLACVGPPVFTSVNLLSAGAATSDRFVATQVGTYRWVATYGGDANNTPVSSGCQAEPVSVTRAAPAISTEPSAGGVVGSAVSDRATVTGGFDPSGTVTFALFPPSDATCAGPPAFTSTNRLGAGSAESDAFLTAEAGTYRWVATYNGDTDNAPASSGCQDEPVTVTPAFPSIGTTPTAGGMVGTAITDTAVVSGGLDPTGSVTFRLFAPGDLSCARPPVFTSTSPLSGGQASSGSFPTTAVGTYRWIAAYSGDANNAGVTSLCRAESVIITRATPAISTTPSAGGAVGTTITDTAAVNGGFGPSGSVLFELFAPDNSLCLGTPVLVSSNPLSGGSATSDGFATTRVGTYRWIAVYGGDASNQPVSSGCQAEPVSVTQGAPALATHPSAGGPVGTAVFDTAAVSGGSDPTGTVTFQLFGPDDASCAGPPAFTSASPLAGHSVVVRSGSFTPAAAGTYRWVAAYSGDANNAGAATGCQAEQVVIGVAQPAVITTLPSPGGPAGTSISDTATVSGGSSPMGTVTFTLFGPADTACAGPPVFTSTDPLVGDSATSGSFATTQAGTYRWVAAYSGDARNTGIASGCQDEPVTIARATPAISTTPSAGGAVGTPVSDTATVTGGFGPTGSVFFSLFAPGDATCAGTPVFTSTDPLGGGGAASGPYPTTDVGTYRWVATYGGDAHNTTTSSGCQDEPVTTTEAVPTISTALSAGGPVGGSIFDTAVISGGFNPTGTVTFRLFSPGDATCAGPPAFTSTNPLTGDAATSDGFATTRVGTYHWVATYSGDASNASVASDCGSEPVTTTPATPAISTTPSAGGPVGTSLSDAATVSGGFDPTGSVTFELFGPGDPACAGTPVLTSTSALTGGRALSTAFPSTAVGTYRWTATYSGDANNAIVASRCLAEPVTTTRARPAISTTPSAGGVVGTAVSDVATVSGGFSPTGTVTFALFPPGNTTCTGAPVFTSTNPLSAGVASSGAFSTTAVGTYRWVATYNGDAGNTPSGSGCQDEPVTTTRATPAISTTPSAGGPAGSAIDDTAAVSGGFDPTGAVTFALFAPDDTACAGQPVFTSTNPLEGGSASSGAVLITAVGTYRWVAVYDGDANNSPVVSRCRAESVIITRATPAISTTPSAGGAVGTTITDTAAVSGGFGPTGTVTFQLFAPDDATCAGVPVLVSTAPLSGGGATSEGFATTRVGTYRWVAVYGGDASNTPVSSGCQDEPVPITQGAPALATHPSAGGPVGTAIFDTAAVSGGSDPTGTVTFQLFGPDDATCAGPPAFTSASPLAGHSVVVRSGSFTPAAAGTYRWVAAYSGDANNTGAATGCQAERVVIGVAQSAVITTLPSPGGPAGTSISDTATVSGGFNPMGTVTFTLFAPADTACAGPPVFTSTDPLVGDSAASGSFATTRVGTYRWVATYGGDTNNTPVSSGCQDEPVTITRATPAISTAPSAGGVVGTPVSDTATVTGGFGPTGSVFFALFAPGDTTCAGTPVFLSTGPLSGSAASGAFATSAAGTYRWVAIYGGDTGNTTAGSGCQAEPVTMTVATPSISTAPSAGGVVGTSISDSATVSGGFGPTGSVTFALFAPGDIGCTGPPVFTSIDALTGDGATSGGFVTTRAGTYRWVATYSGDANNATAGSGCGDEPVTTTRATPAISTTPSPGGPVGISVTDTATVSGGFAPTGTVTFALFAPGDPTCAGSPVFTSTNLLDAVSATSGAYSTTAVGTYHWIATYNGDPDNTPVSSLCREGPVTTVRATPAVSTAPSSGGQAGISITDTATVSGGYHPTGSVTFALFGPTDAACSAAPLFISTSPLNGGVASSGPFSTTVAGTYRWIAVYGGDADNAPSGTGCQDEPVAARAAPAISTTPSAGGPAGTLVHDGAVLQGGLGPTGTVSFALYGPGDGGCTANLVAGDPSFSGIALSGGAARSPDYRATWAGTYQWVATYGGDASNQPASGACGEPGEQVAISEQPPTVPAETGAAAATLLLGGVPLVLLGGVLLLLARRRRDG
ncbi:MAG: VWA domain-containing protein [Chloroflexi bacterium]|nr:MAG: VWA domain-containing protein [Chloroflexota bacterium]